VAQTVWVRLSGFEAREQAKDESGKAESGNSVFRFHNSSFFGWAFINNLMTAATLLLYPARLVTN
jgi:hypothetical protein